MIPDNLKEITDKELLALQQRNVFSGEKSTLTGRESERVWNEIVRRRELKNDPHFGQQVGSSSSADGMAAITNEELLALSKKLTGRDYDRVWDEIVRRRDAKATEAALARPFDPKCDISADARYLWIRIFVWFWLVPFVSGLLYWLVIVALK